MPSLTVPIGAAGPIVRIVVSVSSARREALGAAGFKEPEPTIDHGLIDTGASCTCIDPSIVKALGLTPTGTCPIYSASSDTTPDYCNQYDVGLAILMDNSEVHIVSVTIPVVERPLQGHGFIALIGRDVLSHGLMLYNGQMSTLTLSF